jgi:hypothetical protein
MSRAMMSGPDPDALPMMRRIGLSGNAVCACAAGAVNIAIASHVISRVFMPLPPLPAG